MQVAVRLRQSEKLGRVTVPPYRRAAALRLRLRSEAGTAGARRHCPVLDERTARPVRMLAYASKALQAGEKPASPTLARKAAKLFMQSLDEAGFGEGKVGPGRPRKDAEMDADFLLLRTPEEVEQWERLKDAGEVQDLPQFAPPEAPKKRGFPEYPEGDLIARALRLAFVGGEGEGDSTE